jgi:secreted Zn-dependent insulinase-like peptidase
MDYINIFMNDKLKNIIDNLHQDEFLVVKNSLGNIKKEKDKNLNAETSRYWGEIAKHKYLFNRKEQ